MQDLAKGSMKFKAQPISILCGKHLYTLKWSQWFSGLHRSPRTFSTLSCHSLILHSIHIYRELSKHLTEHVLGPTATMRSPFYYFLIYLSVAFREQQYGTRIDKTRLRYVMSGSSEELLYLYGHKWKSCFSCLWETVIEAILVTCSPWHSVLQKFDR